MSEGMLGRGKSRLGMTQPERQGPGGGDGGVAADGGLSSGTKRRGPQRRKIPGKAKRREYTQAVTQMREDRYTHALYVIKARKDVQEILARECRDFGVEPGGGKPSYGYSELVEMLVARWMEETAGIPGP